MVRRETRRRTADQAPPTVLAASTGYLLARVGMESRRRWARTLAERDLTPHHFGVLMTLEQAGPASQQQLSRLIGIDARNAVPLIDLLEDRALIDRAPDPGDRRRHAVTLTAKGRATLSELRNVAEDVERDMLSTLTATERRNLHYALTKLFTELTRAE
ncbi:MAG: MarR family winged helix-turn-helix transcriptional regulator [Sciscionella sp.]